MLTCLQLGLSWIAHRVTPQQRPVQAKAKSLSALVTTMIRSVKRIAVELRPGVLDELGLVKTLQSLAREFEGHSGIRCRVETNLGKAKFDRVGSVALGQPFLKTVLQGLNVPFLEDIPRNTPSGHCEG